MNRYDLHCHTTHSDGTSSPEEVLQKAKESELAGLSITDHDTISAYETALPLAKNLGLKLISGVEFSAVFAGTSVHILGYSFDLKSEAIRNLCEKHKTRRISRYRAMIELLTKHGIPITEEEVLALGPKGSIGRPHLATVLMQKGFVEDVTQAFHKYLGEGMSCYVPSEVITVQETIDAIHAGNGFAVIAHPHLMKNENVLRELLKMNFDGVEAYYARLGTQQEQRWVNIGKKKGWLITGGSDYHGSIKPNNNLGSSWVREETFQILYSRFQAFAVGFCVLCGYINRL